MTKMQIIAKTILAVLGIDAVVLLWGSYPGRYHYPDAAPVILQVLWLVAFAVLTVVIVYLMVFDNDYLCRQIVGPEDDSARAEQAALLAKSLRIGLVFAGLMLLPRSVPTMIKIPKLFFLVRPAVNDIIIFKRVPDILRLSGPEWFRTIYNSLRAILAIYLVCGAPHFVRWQVRHSWRAESSTNQKSTANSDATIGKG
jgi:amino acid transporter